MCPLQGEGKNGDGHLDSRPAAMVRKGGARARRATPTGRCPTHPDAPTRQHGVHLLADGACREEKQSYSGNCFNGQDCRLGSAEGSGLSHNKRRPDPSSGWAPAAHASWEMSAPCSWGTSYLWGR